MSGIKRETGRTQLEQEALSQQLKRVGLESKADGTIDPASMEQVKGGAAAVVHAAGSDQVLTANEAEGLRSKGLISSLFSPITERATKNAQALTLSVSALSKTFDAALDGRTDIKSLSRRAKALEKELSGLLEGTKLGKVSPEVRGELAQALKDLARSSSSYVRGLTLNRQQYEAALDDGTGRLMGGHGFGERMGGLGRAFLAATATTELTKLIDLMRPLTIIASDLVAPGGATRPIERYISSSLAGTFDAKGTQVIVDTAAELERGGKYHGITRHEVAEGLHLLLDRYYGALKWPDGGDFVARRNAPLLKKHASAEMARSLNGEDTKLTVAEVFAEMLRAAAEGSRDGGRDFLRQLGSRSY